MVIAIDIRLIGKKRTGDEAVFRALTKALIQIEDEATILLLTDERDAAILSMLREALDIEGKKNVEIISLPSPNRYVWNLIVVSRFLRERRVDVFHTQYILPFFVPERTKLFAHIHDISFAMFPHRIGWKDRIFLSLLIPRTVRIADRILAVSEFTKLEIMRQYRVAEERIVVVPNAVGDEFFSQATEADIARVRVKYALPEIFTLSVGTMQPRKNIPFLIRAHAEVLKRVPSLKLLLVGKRNGYQYDTGIDVAIQECGTEQSVLFPGYVEDRDMPAIYAAARVFVFPSEYEGFGIPLLEAMSQGTPVIASDIPPFHEVGGDAVIFFDRNAGIADMAEVLYNAVIDENMRLRFSERGKDRAKFFSWEKTALILRDLFRERSNH